MKVYQFRRKLWRCVDFKVRHENLISNELTRPIDVITEGKRVFLMSPALDKRRFRSWCCERYSPSQEVFDEGLTSETLTSQWSLYCVYLTLINSSDNEFSDYIKMCLWLLGDTRKNPIADRRTRILRNFKYRTLENKTFEKTLLFVCLTG